MDPVMSFADHIDQLNVFAGLAGSRTRVVGIDGEVSVKLQSGFFFPQLAFLVVCVVELEEEGCMHAWMDDESGLAGRAAVGASAKNEGM